MPKNKLDKVTEVRITRIPHAMQRYNTLGDYFLSENGETLHITISDTGDVRDFVLVALHEFIESTLCLNRDIPFEAIDDFDIANPDADEPGELLTAPYFYEHRIATKLEEQLLPEFWMTWKEYDDRLRSL
jgi:hypothetical protein